MPETKHRQKSHIAESEKWRSTRTLYLDGCQAVSLNGVNMACMLGLDQQALHSSGKDPTMLWLAHPLALQAGCICHGRYNECPSLAHHRVNYVAFTKIYCHGSSKRQESYSALGDCARPRADLDRHRRAGQQAASGSHKELTVLLDAAIPNLHDIASCCQQGAAAG
jgi:hypothetical protein